MKKIAVVLCVALLVISGWLWFSKPAGHIDAPVSRVVVALPVQISAGAIFVGKDRGIFGRHGIDAEIQPFITGKQALQSVLQGKADLALVADTPFMFAVMRGEKIVALSTIFGSRKSLAIVARKDRIISRPGDLEGKTVGTVFGTNAQFFLDAMLVAHGVERSMVTVVDLKPDDIVGALRSGKVDAVTVWNPDLVRLQSDDNQHLSTLYGEEIFVYRFLLVGKESYVQGHPDEVRRMLQSMNESTAFIHENPQLAQPVVGKAIGLDPSLLARAFDPNDFYMTLDQTLLLALGEQTRWAMKHGLVPKGAVPNYLNHIRQEPLESVLPSAVTIIR